MARIGVAISGGGHRATVWGLGALMALVDGGLNDDVVSISSVSGGSISNGIVAHNVDFAATNRRAFEDAIRPALRNITSEGLFFFGPSTNGWVIRFFAAAALAVGALVWLVAAALMVGRHGEPWWWLLAGPALALLAWAVSFRKPGLGGVTKAVITLGILVFTSGFALLGALFTRDATGWTAAWRMAVAVLVTAGAVALLLRAFGQRSEVVDRALGRVHFTGPSGPRSLADLADRPVHHVFCATELQSGDHMYFTPKLVYSYRVGIGRPGTLPLSSAVQASACLPGAFVAREFDTKGFGLTRSWAVQDNQPSTPPASVVVNDGGVYDNMADQWEQGFAERLKRLPELAEAQGAADELLVVNAGKALGWLPLGRTSAVGREARGLARTINILYDVTTSHRRQAIVRRFEAASGRRDLRGALVHIAQSPFDIPKAFARSPDPLQRGRAGEALAFLATIGAAEGDWERRAQESPKVPTVLRALGPVAVDLLEHAYLLATVNTYVILGLGDLSDPSRFERSRFEALCLGMPTSVAEEGVPPATARSSSEPVP